MCLKCTIYDYHLQLIDRYRISPLPPIVKKYEDIDLTCTFHKDVQWFTPRGIKNARQYQNTLEIKRATLENNGEYECSGEMDEKYSWSKNKVIFRAKTFLIVIGKNTWQFFYHIG